MTEAGTEIPVSLESKPNLGTVEIPIGPDKVKVSWTEFKPENKENIDPTKAVVFLPGWPWQAKARATWDLPRWLANQFGQTAYSIDTQTGGINQNTLKLEAEGIRQFINSNGIKEVTIFGHSEGAIRAANLAVALEQQNPDVKINGVVLANPMGFYPQSFKELAKNFVLVEIAQVEPKQINPSIPHMPQLKVIGEFFQSLQRKVEAVGLFDYLTKKFPREIGEMRRVEPVLNQIKAPVLILTTDKDFVSNYRRYLPEEEIEKRTAQPVYKGERYESMERRVNVARAREQYTREKILPQAGPIKVIIASRFGSHIGLPVERYKQTAHVVSRIFDRMKKQRPQ